MSVQDWATVYARVAVEDARAARHALRRSALPPGVLAAADAAAAKPTCWSRLCAGLGGRRAAARSGDAAALLSRSEPSARRSRRASATAAAAAAASSSASPELTSIEVHASSSSSSTSAAAPAAKAAGVAQPPGTATAVVAPPKRQRAFRPARAALFRLSLFLSPLLMVLGFFLGLWLSADTALFKIEELAKMFALASLRVSTARSVALSTQSYVTAVPHESGLTHMRGDFLEAIMLLRAVDSRLLSGVDATASPALEGGAAPPELPFRNMFSESSGVQGLSAAASARVSRLLFGNLCEGITARDMELPFNASECETLHNGRLTRGAASALRDFLDASRALVARRTAATITNTSAGTGFITVSALEELGNLTASAAAAAAATAGGGGNQSSAAHGADLPPLTTASGLALAPSVGPWSIRGELTSPSYESLTMLREHLLPAYNAIADEYVDTAEGIALEYQVFLRIYVGVVVAVLCVAMVLLYRPAILRIDRDIRHEQALLLLLPTPVLDATPAANAMILEILRERDAAGLVASQASQLGVAPPSTPGGNNNAPDKLRL